MRTILLAACLGSVAACQTNDESIDYQSYVDTIEPADTLYNQGLANLNSGNLREAARKFEAVDRQLEMSTLMGGKLHVYKRDNSRFWQCSAYLSGKNRRRPERRIVPCIPS